MNKVYRRMLNTAIATVFAAAVCLFGTSSLTFAQYGSAGFSTDSSPWYATDDITVYPEPPIAGQSMEVCAKVSNPTSTGINVLLRFSLAYFGIGMQFITFGESPLYVPPYSTVTDCKMWVPPDPGPWSFEARVIRSGYPDVVVERNIDMSESLEPLTPDTLLFPVRNRTGSTATITLGLVPHLSDWGFELSQDVIPNLAPGAQQEVMLISTPPAVLPPGGSPITDVEAYIGGTPYDGFRKVHTAGAPCEGARLDVTTPLTPVNTATSYEERGAFVTAIRGFQVCAIGMEVDLEIPQVVTARIYEADGTTRGGLLAQGDAWAVRPGNAIHYVPVAFELLPCADYDIAFEYGAANDFDWYDERFAVEPFDLGGVIRVRDGEFAGNATNFALPHLSIIGFSPGDHVYTDLAPEGITWSSSTDGTTERGVFVVPHETITLSSLAWEANFTTVPAAIQAYVFSGTSHSRGPMIATGSALVTTTGLAMHTIPIAAVLEEGKEYDLVVAFPPTTWSSIDENQILLPFTAGGILSVTDGEQGGNPANTILPHFAVEWSPSAGGVPFDLAKTTGGYPPPFTSTDSNTNYGLFLTSAIRQRIYSLGWEADVQPGEPLYAWVFEASGTSRGMLVSEGSAFAVEGQTRWHDIPIAATLEPGADYNIEIGFGGMNAWSFWEDYEGVPYSPYGLFEIYATSQGGSINSHRLIHMRVNGCNASATAIDPRTEGPPRFTLDAPCPNPISTSASLGYRVDEAARVTIAVYDVAGRRVSVLLEDEFQPAGPGRIELDASGLAAGVYFVRMETAAKSVSRKIAVVR
jgi:hypothetical protein